MYLAEVRMRPTTHPRPKTPTHVPDSGSGLIVLSCVILLLAIIRKKFGWFQRSGGW